MPTGRSVATTCPARAAVAGNPSDGYGGAVVAITIDELCAMAAISEADRFSVHATDGELGRLLGATAGAFGEIHGELPPVTLSASTEIPRSVGLGGSSALVIAALRALAAWTGHRFPTVELAQLALSIERDRLGIEAGLQDRLVQAAGGLVAMTFDPITFDVLTPSDDLPLFVAWSPTSAEPSDTVHRSLRRRFDAGDPHVHETMTELAGQAALARRAILDDDRSLLGAAMNHSFDLRTRIIDVAPAQRGLVDVGRRLGAAVNSAGSGGSVVGLARDAVDLAALRSAYERAGSRFLTLE